MSFDYSLIGRRIKQAREEHGITQEILAEKLDVSNAYISKIERGKTPINLDRLSQICVVLEESPEYILSGTNKLSNDYLRNEIIEMLEECPPEKIKLIMQVIKPIIEFNSPKG
ncbi:helix-turn-helix transcriptional regulator [Paenibacillus sp. D2_2]|uniref:helix-turn-helix domain-containing protein n=1 Tax=Paenibacillus sp. D2_2 TaxID=3073092 RepID=UPI002814C2DD|nr:helix-turn-helix transcriptional regulator [Paenibacillus sp. D2_2]WMT38866.1 helix-turn-helix transcriptional regulator [Paenibacillus sp. D2_2]